MNDSKTLDEHAEVIAAALKGAAAMGLPPTHNLYAIVAAYKAERAARVVLGAEIDALRAAPPTTYLHADGTEEPIGELVARLTRELDRARAYAEVAAYEANRVRRALHAAAAERDEARADLAETRAQLARLREAGEAVDEADASGDDTVLGVAIRHLRAALWSTTAESERDRAADAAVHRAVDEQAAAARAAGRAFTPTDHAALDEAAAEAMERKP